MTPRDARAEAVAWLVGRLRFEQLLHDLQNGEQPDETPLQKAA